MITIKTPQNAELAKLPSKFRVDFGVSPNGEIYAYLEHVAFFAHLNAYMWDHIHNIDHADQLISLLAACGQGKITVSGDMPDWMKKAITTHNEVS